MKKSIYLVVMIVVFFSVSIASATIENAKKFWKNGQTQLAFQALLGVVQENPKNHNAWFVMGKYFMEISEYDNAQHAFKNAASLKSEYQQEIRHLYIKHIKICLYQANIVEGEETYDRKIMTIKANNLIRDILVYTPPDLRQGIFKEIELAILAEVEKALEEKKFKLTDVLVTLIPGQTAERAKTLLYELVMDYGDKVDDFKCIDYYEYASKQEVDHPRSILAAERLWKVAKYVESMFIDKDFEIFSRAERFKKVARLWNPSYPPESIPFSYDNTQIKVKANEVLEYWMEARLWAGDRYNIKKIYGGRYLLLFDTGLLLRSWETGKGPDAHIIKFKIMPIDEDSEFNLIVSKQ
jgi:hypothetical protein